jgi:tetratricopeptide (TPR) repeat protein
MPPEVGATRRSDRPENVLDFRALGATRRTGEADEEAVVPPPPLVAEPEPAPAAPRRRWRRWALLLLAVLLVALGGCQIYVRSEARDMRRALVEPKPDLDALLAQYRGVSPWAPLGFGLGSVPEELRQAFVRQADEILLSYQGDNPRTTEKGWERARDYLRAAVDIQFTDRKSRARMIYAQAHLDRIAAQTSRAEGKEPEARAHIDAAISGFRDAARRDAEFADPYLGLARVYAYDRFDLEELQKALGELGKRGYHLGRREKAMLADGFRMRGIELQERALRTGKVDDQITWLDMAANHLRQAIDLYAEIPGYADVRKNKAEAERRLAAIQARLGSLEQPGALGRILGEIGRALGEEIEKNNP